MKSDWLKRKFFVFITFTFLMVQPASLWAVDTTTENNQSDPTSSANIKAEQTISHSNINEVTKPAQKEPPNSILKSPFINSQTSVITPKPVGFTDFFSAFIALIFIVMLIFFLAWFGKRTGLVNTSGRQIIKIIDSTSVGYKEKIALIEVGEEQVLIGITSSRIDKLMVLEHPVKLEENNSQNLLSKNKASFINTFNQIKNKANKSTE